MSDSRFAVDEPAVLDQRQSLRGRVTMIDSSVSSDTEALPDRRIRSTAYFAPASTATFTVTGSVPAAAAVTFAR